jgi:hypothetical protein
MGNVVLVSEDYYEVEVARRRGLYAALYDALPQYGSTAFWQAVSTLGLPIEVLVRCLRMTLMYNDLSSRNRLLELIVLRTQANNEQWSYAVLGAILGRTDERQAYAADLYSDLCERILHALLDPQRHFWEENFWHCVYFERKHVYRSFMIREGHWSDPRTMHSDRIPRALLRSLPPATHGQDEYGRCIEADVEDDRVPAMFQAIELRDLLSLVLSLPEQLKAVVLLIFWEEKSEKETALALGITDRTVRNRLRAACTLLRGVLAKEEKEASYE